RIDAHWDQRASDLRLQPGEEPGETFVRLVRSGLADSYLILDEDGNLAYPNQEAIIPTPTEPQPPAADDDRVMLALMAEAERVEFAMNEPAQAAELYAQIAELAEGDQLTARALLAQARCLLKSAQAEPALAILLETLSEPRFRYALDA